MLLVIPAIILVFGYVRIYDSWSILPMTAASWSTGTATATAAIACAAASIR